MGLGPRERDFPALMARRRKEKSADRPGSAELSTISLSSRQARQSSPSPMAQQLPSAYFHAQYIVSGAAVRRLWQIIPSDNFLFLDPVVVVFFAYSLSLISALYREKHCLSHYHFTISLFLVARFILNFYYFQTKLKYVDKSNHLDSNQNS